MTDINTIVTASGGKTQKSQVFTASGTWTRPDGVDAVWVFVVGGGGGGGGVKAENLLGDTDSLGGGGGGGAQVKPWMPVPVSGNVTVTVGSGGSGGTSGAGSDGSAGGSSSFAGDVTVTALGGGAGAGMLGSSSQTGQITPTSSEWSTGGNSRSSTSGAAYGGGGAGAAGAPAIYDYQSLGPSDFAGRSLMVSTDLAQGYGGMSSGQAMQVHPGPGYQSMYGVGGPGGMASNSATVESAPYRSGGARQAFATSGSQAGYDGPANTGCAGGGAASHGGSASGGDGADGVVLVVWQE